ncbi:MAG: tRNA (N6-threonylcarbamoyladenosine(37)-N6)-methyltransferase TrmO [Anaerolineales bacterium]|nr:tRNA (N6-threonylcarbamoyladenosine(37)-N6)-methyltransferase TrmO [Anaerolineales bacterium]MBS3753170.1 tRNA (N6-threonylcarbamoyladenosine(37)-N6)-methyltransferase TrmO [Anaerolineales bacterium]
MRHISAQVIMDPLKEKAASPGFKKVLNIFHQHGLDVRSSPQRIQITGEGENIFAAVKEVFQSTPREPGSLITATISHRPPGAGSGEDSPVSGTATFHPIGFVENRFDASSSREEMRSGESRISLHPALTNGLKGLSPGEQVLVLFYFDRTESFDLHQHPRGDRDRKKRGVFTLRSPRRPNPIGATVVDVVSITGNVLTVRGLDAFDGTPVLDIKPA